MAESDKASGFLGRLGLLRCRELATLEFAVEIDRLGRLILWQINRENDGVAWILGFRHQSQFRIPGEGDFLKHAALVIRCESINRATVIGEPRSLASSLDKLVAQPGPGLGLLFLTRRL